MRESASDVAIRVNNLGKCYQIYNTPRDRLRQFVVPRLQRLFGQPPKQYFREFWALKDVSFEIKKGETMGIIGRNGSGKSTLLQLICGTLNPTSGSVKTNGRVAALLELGSGFNPEFTGRENVYMNAAIMGLAKEEIDARFDEIAAFADIGNFIELPIKYYSSGMFVRLAFATAINMDPDILIIDEALSVGDIAFQQKCYTHMTKIKEKGTTILFASHDLNSFLYYCNRAMVLIDGQKASEGTPRDMVEFYRKSLTVSTVHCEAFWDIQPQRSKFNHDKLLCLSFERNPNCIEYGDGVVKIVDWGILDEHGNPTSVIQAGQRITIFLRVFFAQDCKNPIIGFFIKNLKGQEITGVNTMNLGKDVGYQQNGNVVDVRFEHVIALAAGAYSLCLGCSEYLATDELAAHHRLYDIVLFQVTNKKQFVGIFDPNSSVEIETVKISEA